MNATQIAAAVAAREISPVEVAEEALRAAELSQPVTNAFSQLRPEETLAEARALADALARGGEAGPLAGVPVAIKDILALTEGVRTTFGMEAIGDWVPPFDSAVVRRLREAGATLTIGHSAHVPHGAADRVLYDTGDFLDDYAVDPRLRNDLGLLFLVTLDARGPVRLEALPLKLEFCHTRLAADEDAAWIRRRFRTACAALGTTVEDEAGRLTISWR